MRTTSKVAAALVALVVAGSWLPESDPEPNPREVAASSASPSAEPSPPPATQPSPQAVVVAPAPADNSTGPDDAPAADQQQDALLQARPGGDGDSWRDTTGREYRLGMVNAPETGDCYGSEATAERKRLTAGGFRAAAYTTDRYGREVSVVRTGSGVNVNVHLARHGFADDRYLARFRHENPSLAAELDRAFAAAKAERAGLWGACSGSAEAQGIATPPPAAAPAPAASDCHPDYATCIPVQGDGSGRGAANDLDCGDLDGAVRLRQADVDPYRLDADGDGVGCDS